MSKFPNTLDTDLELPRVDIDVTEISGDAVNALRDAVFAIQRNLGAALQGDMSNLASRLNVSVDSQGRIKQSALEEVGLVSLPITNTHIGANAGIEESKLDLDFSTQGLKTSINYLETNVSALQSNAVISGAQFSSHVLGQSNLHDGYQIKINSGAHIGVGGLSATTVGDAINEITAVCITGDGSRPAHIDSSLPITIKHIADFISVDASGFVAIDSSSENVQQALESIDVQVLSQQAGHIDDFHSNGIFRNIRAGNDYNTEKVRITSLAVSYGIGESVVAFTGLGGTFISLGVEVGDVINIESGDDAGTYQILDIGPQTTSETLGNRPELSSSELRVAHTFSSTNTSTASVYGASSISSENAPLACSIRHLGTPVDSVTVINPDSARVTSFGFNGSILNTLPNEADGYQLGVRVGVGGGTFRTVVIPNLHYDRLGLASADPVSAISVAERINAYVSDPDGSLHFPISAALVGDELVIAHNWVGPDYTLEILSGYNGNFALGLDDLGAGVEDLVLKGNLNNSYVVNGSTLNTIATKFSGTCSISSDSQTLILLDADNDPVNPVSLGIFAGDILNVSNHPTTDVNGSYVLESVGTSSVTVYLDDEIPAPTNPTTFSAWVTHSNVSLEKLGGPENDKGIAEIFVDQNGATHTHQILAYSASLGTATDIIDVSPGFPTGSFLLNISEPTATPSLRQFNVVDAAVPGESVIVDANFKGSFKLYHSNNIDYLTVRIGSGVLSSASTSFTVSSSLNPDETLSICRVHFDGDSELTHLSDTRIFGNVGTGEIRDDFVQRYIESPLADLHSDGVARGFDLLAMPYLDSVTDMQALPVAGGTAYVGGVRVVTSTQKVTIPSYDGVTVIANKTFVVCINKNGSIRAFDDDLSETLEGKLNADYVFDKIVPLFEVTVTDGIITGVVDVRKFINNIGDKIELVVDETNNVVGNFRTIEGALRYAQKFPNGEKLTVKIINNVYPSGSLIVPDGVSLFGVAAYGGTSYKIINQNSITDAFITLSGNNNVKNIVVECDNASFNHPLILIDGDNIDVEKCSFSFTDVASISSNSGNIAIRIGENASDRVRVVDNIISRVFGGVESEYGVDNIVIRDNIISEVQGVGSDVFGVKVGSYTRSILDADISGNRIRVPNVLVSNIKGVFVDVDNIIDTLRIENNNIIHNETIRNTMTSGIHIENTSSSGLKVRDAFLTNNLVQGVSLNDDNVSGIFVADVKRAKLHSNVVREIGFLANTNTSNSGIYIQSSVDVATVSNNIVDDCAANSCIRVAVSGATISHNTIANQTNNSTNLLELEADNQNITNNTFDGNADSAIYASGTINKSIISGNNIIATTTTGINMPGAENCIVEGNMLSTAINIIGPTPDSTPTFNTNLIGINKGMDDTIGISLGECVSSFSKDGSGVYSYPHWFMDGDRTTPFQSWVCSKDIGDPDGGRRLYVPLSRLPNGSEVTSISVSGVQINEGSLTMQAFRRYHSDQTGDGVAISPIITITSAGDFDGATNTTGLVDIVTGNINHSLGNYYLLITSSGVITSEPKITSIRATVRY